MSFNAGAIVGNLKLDDSQFFGAINSAGEATVGATGRMGLAVAGVQFALNAVATIAKSAFAAAVGAIGEFADRADGMRDLSQQTGVSTEVLSGLELAAKQSGTSLDTMGQGLKILAKNAAEAAMGNKTLQADFARLGVQVTDSAGNLRPMGDILKEVATGLDRLPSGAAQVNAAMSVLGKSGAETIPAFKGGAKSIEDYIELSRRLGVSVTQESGDIADRWNDTTGQASIGFEGLRNAFSRGFLGEAVGTTEEQTDRLVAAFASVRPQLERVGAVAGQIFSRALVAIPEVAAWISDTARIVQDVLGALKPVWDVLEAILGVIAKIQGFIGNGIGKVIGAAVYGVNAVGGQERAYAAAGLDQPTNPKAGTILNVNYSPEAVAEDLVRQVKPQLDNVNRQTMQQLEGAAQQVAVADGM